MDVPVYVTAALTNDLGHYMIEMDQIMRRAERRLMHENDHFTNKNVSKHSK